MSRDDMREISWSEIASGVKSQIDWVIQNRRWFHAHPELAFQEHKTSAYIQNKLTELGIEFQAAWGKRDSNTCGTGIVAHIGIQKSPCIFLRADMDALPVQEETGLDFASSGPNMHACGHDAHLAILLGVAKYLKSNERLLHGTVLLIFQPAEEVGAGASCMINEGCLRYKGFQPLAGFGLHVFGNLETGIIAGKPGPILAGASHFDVAFHGLDGHASAPQLAKNPIVPAAHFISSLYKQAEPFSDPSDPDARVVVSITSFQTPQSYNVIPREAFLKGTLRAFDQGLLIKMKNTIVNEAKASAQSANQNCTVKFFTPETPITLNHPGLHDWMTKILQSSDAKWHVLPAGHMASEDFALYGQSVPSYFIILGARSPGGPTRQLHQSTFQIDENCLQLGVTLMSFVALKCLDDLLVHALDTGV